VNVIDKYFSDKYTIIHCDGQLSQEKSSEHSSRRKALRTQLDTLVAGAQVKMNERKAIPFKIYNKCKSIYRISDEYLEVILKELQVLG
jgi:hypothetical protein